MPVLFISETINVISMSFGCFTKKRFGGLGDDDYFCSTKKNLTRMNYERLCKGVELETGRKILTPTDFDWLSDQVEARTKVHISASTLMRVWGYRQGVTPRRSTLDVLARYLGYADYALFCDWAAERDGEPQSDEVVANHIETKDLTVGDRLLLTWNPGRRCVVELRDDGRFEVVEAEVTKLSVGDTFACSIFVEHEPLYMSELVHEGGMPMVYVAGKKDGIRFSLRH